MNTEKTGSSLFILYDQLRWEEKAIIESAKKKGIDIGIVNCRNTIIDLEQNEDYSDRIMIQRCVSYYNNVHTTAAIEGLGAIVINSLQTAIFCGNKLFSHMKLRKAGVNVPRAFCAFSQESALTGLGDHGYPKVIKPVVGSWGRLIALLKDKESAEAVIEDREHMYPLYHIYYFEDYVTRPPRDIRAIVVGDMVAAAIYRYSGNDSWKTNMALGGTAKSCEITKELEEICLRAAKAVNAEIAGVDLMESDDRGLLVHEVNNTTEFKNAVRVTGVDIPSIMIDHCIKLKKRQ
ncbi:MAG: lysine biosynthesis protein LysX [Thermoproteota archaeon]|nr:lysine biosynthesis protein LysX [Thermoproteota archaeon]